MKKIITLSFLLPTLLFAMTGLKIGDKAPKLELESTDSKMVNFSKLKNDTIVVFYRGAWCPYCIKQLKSIELDIAKKIKGKADIIAVSVDRSKVAKKMKDEYKFSFVVLSDTKAKSLKAFNIVNKLDDKLVKKYKASYKIDVEADSGETHHMVAHPAVFIIKDGKIAFVDVQTDYKVRTNNQDILKAL